MTGEKSRGTTVEKMWKLDDKYLSTPQHDDLVLKLLDEQYVRDNIIPEDEQDVLDINIVSEKPIFSGRSNFIIGFIDVYIRSTFNKKYMDLMLTCPEDQREFLVHPESNHSVYNERRNNLYHLGDCRDNKNLKRCTQLESPNLCYIKERKEFMENIYIIECKPRIDSFGETLRQINLYRENITNVVSTKYNTTVYFILFTPDTRFEKEFLSQGIYMISP